MGAVYSETFNDIDAGYTYVFTPTLYRSWANESGVVTHTFFARSEAAYNVFRGRWLAGQRLWTAIRNRTINALYFSIRKYQRPLLRHLLRLRHLFQNPSDEKATPPPAAYSRPAQFGKPQNVQRMEELLHGDWYGVEITNHLIAPGLWTLLHPHGTRDIIATFDTLNGTFVVDSAGIIVDSASLVIDSDSVITVMGADNAVDWSFDRTLINGFGQPVLQQLEAQF